MQPAVSVIVPVYNPGGYLKQCLDSLVNQTLDPESLQIILVNDGSTDGSGDVLHNYADRHDNIVVIDKENGGYGQSMNCGLDRAQGTYIGIVEPDDYVDVHMYEDLYNAALKFDSLPDIVRSAYWRVLRNGKGKEYITPSPHKGNMKPSSQPFKLADCDRILYGHPAIWTGIYRRDFLAANGIRFKEIPGAGWADNPFYIQTLCLADSIAYVDECYYFYREDMIDGSERLKDYTIPFDRWDDMQDFIDERGIDEPVLKESMAARGFAYIVGARKALDAEENADKLDERERRMFMRMDTDAVIGSDKILVSDKKRYLSVIDPDFKGSLGNPLSIYKTVPKQFFSSLRQGGISTTLFKIKVYLARR